jgi:hypothetical protein
MHQIGRRGLPACTASVHGRDARACEALIGKSMTHLQLSVGDGRLRYVQVCAL